MAWGCNFDVARKEKGTNNWYIGAITDEHSRTATLTLDFLDKGKKYQAIIYKDAATAHWKNNPEAYSIEKRTVDSNTQLSVVLAEGGGMAVSLTAF